MFRGSVKGTGYPLHSPVSPSLPLPCVTVCNHISIGLYLYHFLMRVSNCLKMGFRLENFSNFRTEGSITGHELASVGRGHVLVILSAERRRIEIVLCAVALSSRKNQEHFNKFDLFFL